MYSDKERKIFGPYFDGLKDHRYGDPLKIRNTLTIELDGDPNGWFQKTNHPDKIEKSRALEKVSAACRLAFDLAPFDPATGKGSDELLCLQTLDAFLKWQDAKKVQPSGSPTPSPLPASGNDQPSATSSGSTSTKRGSPDVGAWKLPRGSRSTATAPLLRPAEPTATQIKRHLNLRPTR